MNYFTAFETLDQLKTQYRALAFANHPDHGGDLATMQAINAEYAQLLTDFAKGEAHTRQASAHADNRKSAADFHDMDAVGAELKARIEFALNLDGVDVELIGLWIWLTGNTKAHKDALKANGWKWSPKKIAWYFAGVPSFNRKSTTLDEIRDAYGSQHFKKESRPMYEDAGRLTA